MDGTYDRHSLFLIEGFLDNVLNFCDLRWCLNITNVEVDLIVPVAERRHPCKGLVNTGQAFVLLFKILS